MKKSKTAEDVLFESHHNLRPLRRDAKASKRADQRKAWKAQREVWKAGKPHGQTGGLPTRD